MQKIKAKLASIALSFLRAFASGATLGQLSSDLRGSQAILMSALFAGGAAALRTVQAMLEQVAGTDTGGDA